LKSATGLEQAPSADNPQRYLVWILVAFVVSSAVAVPMYYYVVARSPTAGISIFDAGPQSCPANDYAVCGFSPRTATVPFGSPVFWTNNGRLNHTVTSTGYPSTAGTHFDSGIIHPGEIYNFELSTKAGTYTYYCRIHTWMTGTVVVG